MWSCFAFLGWSAVLCRVFGLVNWSFSLLLFRFPTSFDPFRCLNLLLLMRLFIGEFVLFVSMLVLVLFLFQVPFILV